MASPLSSANAMPFERLQLDENSWVDIARNFLTYLNADAQEVFETVRDQTDWYQGNVFRYERNIPERRLSASSRSNSEIPHDAIRTTWRKLQHHYGIQFTGYALSYYRNENDLLAMHRDRDMRWLDRTVIALLVLGARRPFHLSPRHASSTSNTSTAALHDLAPGEGDLIVMGGACQENWLHGVPGVSAPTGGRISVQWRWTAKSGRPQIGPGYRAPRYFSRGA